MLTSYNILCLAEQVVNVHSDSIIGYILICISQHRNGVLRGQCDLLVVTDLQYFHNIADEVWQLVVQFDLHRD